MKKFLLILVLISFTFICKSQNQGFFAGLADGFGRSQQIRTEIQQIGYSGTYYSFHIDYNGYNTAINTYVTNTQSNIPMEFPDVAEYFMGSTTQASIFDLAYEYYSLEFYYYESMINVSDYWTGFYVGFIQGLS